jgi:hypothetical protein
MLKFSVQTFYQPLFTNSFPLSNLPLALSLQQFIFPSASFSPPKAPTSKAQSLFHSKSKSPQNKSKSWASSFSESFIPSGIHGGAAVLREGHDIVTGETCVPASLNVNNLGEAAVLHLPLL